MPPFYELRIALYGFTATTGAVPSHMRRNRLSLVDPSTEMAALEQDARQIRELIDSYGSHLAFPWIFKEYSLKFILFVN